MQKVIKAIKDCVASKTCCEEAGVNCNQGRKCPVREGTHKPAEAVHQIQEPAPATAMDALREAEAALEVAMARILKADPGHSICVTSEAKALVAVRAALAAPAPMLVAQPQLHAALFAARGALQHMKEGGKPTQSLLNEAIAAIDSVAVTQAAPAAVAVPTKVIEALEMLENGALNVATNAKNRGDGYDEGYANAMAKMARETLDGLAATPAAVDVVRYPTEADPATETLLVLNNSDKLIETPPAAPVVLPEPVSDEQIKAVFLANGFTIKEGLTDLKPYVYQAARALLATGGQAQAVEQAPVLYVSKGQLDNHRDPDGPDSANAGRYLPARITPAGNFTMPLFAAPQAQADARDAIRELIAKHSEELEHNAYAYFELAYTRRTGWMAWITDKPLNGGPVINPDRTVLCKGQGDTPEEACSAAIAAAKGE